MNKERTVWVWPPDQGRPLECGTFQWRPGAGRFMYSPAYQGSAHAVALDPVKLGFNRRAHPLKEDMWNGLFGVFRDASPEGFGLDLLRWKHNRDDLDEIDRLGLSSGDAVGALEVCTEEELERKLAYEPPSLQVLCDLMQTDDLEMTSSKMIQNLSKTNDVTSLGGEKPKLTVLVESSKSAPQWWIAKLQERTGPPLMTEREYLAMTLAHRCGLDVAPVRFERVGRHRLLLIKRFDRELVPEVDQPFQATSRRYAVHRKMFASAETVLRPRGLDPLGDPERSYVGFAHDMQRWGGSRTSGFEQQQQELWRRMSFNALVGNHDDHVRNHGLLYRDGKWTLSPAYDIVAMPSFNRVLAMAVTPDGSRRVSAENLVRYAEHFSLAPEDAWETLQKMARLIVESWQELLVTECQVKPDALALVEPSFNFAQCIVDQSEVPQFASRKSSQRKKS